MATAAHANAGTVAPSKLPCLFLIIYLFSPLLLKHVLPMREIISIYNIGIGEGWFGLAAAAFLRQSLPTALYDSSAQPAGMPPEEKKESQDGTHASPAGCSRQMSNHRKIQ